jgi:Dyp-type peroxidase family
MPNCAPVLSVQTTADGSTCCEAAVSEHLDLDDIQGLVIRGYGRLPHAAFLLLAVTTPDEARRFVAQWVPRLATGAQREGDVAVNLALTATGLRRITGSEDLVDGFAEPFRTGMVTPYRSRLLGDEGANDPASWAWGGPGSDPVDAVALIYARDPELLTASVRELVQSGTDAGMRLLRRLDADELGPAEPFGFHDGISQPILAGLPRAASAGADEAVVPDGEFVLGYVNGYGQRTERPLLAPTRDPERILPRDPDGSGAADLGRNGSYLVLRQLWQDVEGFWQYVDGQAAREGRSRERVAAALVGRWPSGAPLVLAPEHDDPTKADANDFGYHHVDPDGTACPVGAHVRRANPRDALPPRPGTSRSLDVNHRHRLLRRGRNYTAGDERGLYFACLNTNIARQYEFVQHSWLNDPGFNGLVGVEDPLVGPRVHGPSTFVAPARPVRRRVTGLPQFVRPRGGAYFFLPGLRALRYLASAPPVP